LFFISDIGKKYSGASAESVKRLIQEITEQGIQINPWPQSLELNGSPGQYEAVIKYGSQTRRVQAGAVILDLFDAGPEVIKSLTGSNLINRVIARQHYFSRVSSLDSTLLHSFTVRETAGIFIVVHPGNASSVAQITMGEAAASRASGYLGQETFLPRASSVVINSRLCRACGDCIHLCPYIELKNITPGPAYAWVDPALCFGCGACISVCPTGAITQPLQSEIGITRTLEYLLRKTESVSEA
jgi:ferredoxin